MPRALEMELRKRAIKKGLSEKRKKAYVYRTLQKVTDWKPGKK